jgi:ABC-type spermidine/putrescine transport system permease subunit II
MAKQSMISVNAPRYVKATIEKEKKIMNEIQQLLPILIPLVVIGIILTLVAILDLRKQPSTRGPKWMWALFICCITFWGSLAYFTIGRKEE